MALSEFITRLVFGKDEQKREQAKREQADRILGESGARDTLVAVAQELAGQSDGKVEVKARKELLSSQGADSYGLELIWDHREFPPRGVINFDAAFWDKAKRVRIEPTQQGEVHASYSKNTEYEYWPRFVPASSSDAGSNLFGRTTTIEEDIRFSVTQAERVDTPLIMRGKTVFRG